MNEDNFVEILKQIVIDSAYSESGLQINSFYFADDDPQLDAGAFGASYQDYLDGRFWSRSWVLGGGDESTMTGQFPALIVETRDFEIECLGDPQEEDSYFILLVDETGCVDCPDHGARSKPRVKRNVRTMLASYLRELSTYTKYDITGEEPADDYQAWLAPGRAELLNVGDVDVNPIDDIVVVLGADKIPVAEWGNHPKRVAYYAQLKPSWCRISWTEFEYVHPEPSMKGIIKTDC